MLKKIFLSLLCILFTGFTISAAPITTSAATPADNTPRVVSITIFHTSPRQIANTQALQNDSTNGHRKHTLVAYPGNIIRFTISNPLVFLQSRPNDQAKVVLYVNGIEMQGITANWYSEVTSLQLRQNSVPVMKAQQDINIVLVRNAASLSSWNFLYNNAAYFLDSYIDVGNVSIGWESMAPLDTDIAQNTLTIAFFYWWEMLLWVALLIIILTIFIILACRTDVIRESPHGAYSLSYTQLLFWNALVIAAFIYTLLLTDTISAFNSSILYMIGISFGTTGFASMIDNNKLKTKTVVTKPHGTFLKDLLTDGNSYSVQRIQAFSWNLILGFYFVVYTILNKTMPEFSSTLLFLAGFSSSAYLAAKLPENTAVPSNPPVGDAKVTEPS